MLLKSLLLFVLLIIACIVQQMYNDKGAKHKPAMKVVFEGDSISLQLTPKDTNTLQWLETLSTVSSKGEKVVYNVSHNLWFL